MIQPHNNISIAPYTNYKIGGVTREAYFPANAGEFYEVMVKLSQGGVPWYILGGGSNVLVGDGYWDGAVIITTSMSAIETFDDQITCGAGLDSSRVAEIALEYVKTGLEFLYKLPGTIGGALAMNARYDMINIADSLIDFQAVHPKNGIRTFMKGDIDFFYKHNSIIHEGWYICEITMTWQNGIRENIRQRMDDIELKRREGGHFDYPSCGCIFKNDYEHNIQVGRLLDEMGFKGYRSGDAQVSGNHANFIVNTGKATAGEVLSIIKHIEHRVKVEKGIDLEREVQLLGAF